MDLKSAVMRQKEIHERLLREIDEGLENEAAYHLWLQPFRDAWDDPKMDVYDEIRNDQHYTDVSQLSQWRKENE